MFVRPFNSLLSCIGRKVQSGLPEPRGLLGGERRFSAPLLAKSAARESRLR